MVFSGITFLYLFLPCVLAIYFIVPKSWRNAVLLLASLTFYFYGERIYTWLLLFSSVSDWLHSLYIEAHRGKKSAKVALISSIIVNVGLLGIFKYLDFFIGIINTVFGSSIPLMGIELPIGISFFTFQTMSYTIDVYRGDVKADRNFTTFMTFVSLFPQLVAGPIVRYSDIDAELKERSLGVNRVAQAAVKFTIGLSKKVLIADQLAEVCKIYSETADKTVLFAWVSAICYALQIYFDFSGYSDMAVGLGNMFGFTFPENFRYPFCAASITDFWRRWHMTLGQWFRDYVYIPLGGNRCSTARHILNILVVWALTGLWHGAEYNFVIWGAAYGILLLAEKLIFGKFIAKHKVAGHIYVIIVSIFMFTVFGAESLSDLSVKFGAMFGTSGYALSDAYTVYVLRNYALILVIALVGSTPFAANCVGRICKSKAGESIVAVLQPILIAALLIICTAFLVDGSFSPFMYFRF